MDFVEYQTLSRKYARYPKVSFPSDTGSNYSGLPYVALGLTGEAGEVAEKVKKYIRDGTIDHKALVLELGDVMWYLARGCDECNVSMADVAAMNIDKLESRLQRGRLGGSGDNR